LFLGPVKEHAHARWNDHCSETGGSGNRDVRAQKRQLRFERVALAPQGGGALGACQAGVYEALAGAA
jgi:hypothetical protein